MPKIIKGTFNSQKTLAVRADKMDTVQYDSTREKGGNMGKD